MRAQRRPVNRCYIKVFLSELYIKNVIFSVVKNGNFDMHFWLTNGSEIAWM